MNSTVTIKGQITIPKAMREYLGLQPGDEVVFTYLESGGVRIEPAGRARRGKRPKGRFAALRGRAGKAPRTDALMELLRGYEDDAKDPGFRT
ncbi:MAG TPA: AbrB/MazE/SpoVT family DNA-binding domain-containing protein [Usitatibacter sp.]|jgi:AbrB family looped-hinge helix DNA binding protein|nr:AbrB/MazE/SpoVT family DNA-binding domain-containing protein [Usitatibacter sp.]